jgi:hypothetical protein
MDRRTFADVSGLDWQVWEVYPRLVERRLLRERRTLRRGTEERRHELVGRKTQPLQIKGGWLAFQSKLERRRLMPVPDAWEELTDRELRALLMHSKVTSRPRRIVADARSARRERESPESHTAPIPRQSLPPHRS